MEIGKVLLGSLKESLVITLIILVLMIIVEIVVLKYRDKIIKLVRNNKIFGYIISSFFGSIPGCIGTFAMDSLYMTGLLGFGGIIAAMIATSGDEAFILIGMAVKGDVAWSVIITLMGVLFLLGIVGAFLADFVRKKLKLKFCKQCKIEHHSNEEFNFKHFFKEHLFKHIIKKHIWQIFVWLFMAIFIINLFSGHISFDFSNQTLFLMLIGAALLGVLPISGPNVVLIVLFSKGIIPFSVLLTNSIIQDGHGLLPIIGFSIKDAVKIKIFNLLFGLAVGTVLLLFGF